jgi:hypothetical protein
VHAVAHQRDRFGGLRPARAERLRRIRHERLRTDAVPASTAPVGPLQATRRRSRPAARSITSPVVTIRSPAKTGSRMRASSVVPTSEAKP